MTRQEVAEKMSELNVKANRAIERQQIALQAFTIACAREQWSLAEREQTATLEHLGEYLDAVQATYRLRGEAP